MNVISEENKRNVFFYADQYAKYYDLVEELTQPYIDLIHDTMVDLLVYSLTWKNRKTLRRPFYVLDVASGTGAEAFRLLDRFNSIHIVAIDFSPPMNREFRSKFSNRFPGDEFETHVTLIEDDFFGEACTPKELVSHLPGSLEPRAFDAVIAGFFLNHYHIETQREFYRRAHNVLRPGGVLVLGEGIGFESHRLSDFAHAFGESWIQKQFSNPEENLIDKYNLLGSDANLLRHKWIDHWQSAHIYVPDATFVDNQKKDGNRVNQSYAGMAKDVGFKEIGFPFRLWEAGVLWATK